MSSWKSLNEGDRSPSLHFAKEGGFVRNSFMTFILFSDIQIPAEIFKLFCGALAFKIRGYELLEPQWSPPVTL